MALHSLYCADVPLRNCSHPQVVVDLQFSYVISETYEDMATGTQQIRPFQRPHSSLKTSQQETPSNIYK